MSDRRKIELGKTLQRATKVICHQPHFILLNQEVSSYVQMYGYIECKLDWYITSFAFKNRGGGGGMKPVKHAEKTTICIHVGNFLSRISRRRGICTPGTKAPIYDFITKFAI